MKFKHSSTLSSNGVETTTGANTVIEFSKNVNSLTFITENSDLHLKINDNDNYFFVKIGDLIVVEDINITKITIQESGVSYRYYAMCY